MKKLMFIAIAAIAGSLCASEQITSANVVGYQTKSFDQNKYNAAIATFVPVAVSGNQMTLKDIVPNDAFCASESQICFIKNTGANAKVKFGGEDVSQTYIYWKESDEPEQGAGWYLVADEDATINQSDVTLPFGDGFLIYRKNADAAVTFAGQVSSDPTTKGFSVKKYSVFGNCSPAAIKLGDITCNDAFHKSESQICFIKPTGANAKVMFGGKEVSQTYIYWKESDEPEQGAGWYLVADEAATVNQNEAVELAAGEGFLVYIKDLAAEITIPSALK